LVFFKDCLIDWPFTKNEKSQLLDLTEDWGTYIVTDVWEWNVHSGIYFVSSLISPRFSAMNPEHNVKSTEEVLDWARV
jgi:hypothetical protein